MARIITVANLKGGVGKTTVAVNVACCLAGKHRVVMVDADAQGSATSWAKRGELPAQVVAMPLESERQAEAWARRVADIDADFVVVDAPPHMSGSTAAAIGLADLVVVPVGASVLDLDATRPALELVAQAREARKGKGPKVLLVPSKADTRTLAGREIETALAALDEAVGPPLHLRVAYADAVAAGAWAGSYEPGGPAHQEVEKLTKLIRELTR